MERFTLSHSPLNRILVWLAVGFALAFLSSLHLRPYPLSWAVKTIPIACMAFFAFLNFPGKKGRVLGLGFSFSALGDILLEVQFQGLFEAGMGAFILAHFFYIFVFIRHPAITPARAGIMAGMALFTLGFGWYLFPFLGPMALPIYIYLGVIFAMGISACLGRSNHGLVIAGAALFIFSDAIIAYTKFVRPLPLSSFWVMLTYYGAQSMLAAGAYQSGMGRASGGADGAG